MFLQQSTPGLNFGSVQLSSGNSSNIQQLAPINMQGQVVQTNQIQSGMNTGHIGTTQHMIQQHTLQTTSNQVMLLSTVDYGIFSDWNEYYCWNKNKALSWTILYLKFNINN